MPTEIEVFIGFTKDDDFTLLKQTLEAWAALVGPEHISAVQCNPKKFETARRVAADNMAKGDHYLLVDLGCVPTGSTDIDMMLERMEQDDGLAIGGLSLSTGRSADVTQPIPTGVRMCRKGAVTKWLPKQTDSYDKEHAQSAWISRTNRISDDPVTVVWPDLYYTHIRKAS